MRAFYQILGNVLISAVTNNFVWFALTYWSYLETKSVITTSLIGGIFLTATALSSFWFGSIVDHHKKQTAMIFSSIGTLVFFVLGFLIYITAPDGSFSNIANPRLWLLIITLMLGVVAGNIKNIALPTVTTLLVEEKKRDRANGLSGSVFGVSFAITSVASGLVLGYLGMAYVFYLAIGFTVLSLVHLLIVSIPEKKIAHAADQPKKIDIKGTIKVVRSIPGLFPLIFFTTFNNFLGGVYMSLMDAYGLSLMSVQAWGILWGFLSFGFILGGLIIAKKGLGKSPLRTLFIANIIMWTISIFFTIQPWIWLLAAGMLVWICLMPFVEASEQTIIQKVVPPERQGRVFGFATSVEQAASPLTAFIIGPIAQLIFIPFMTTGNGAELIGDWYGTGTGRGIALVFSTAGILGLIVTIFAFRSKPYKLLSSFYKKN